MPFSSSSFNLVNPPNKSEEANAGDAAINRYVPFIVCKDLRACFASGALVAEWCSQQKGCLCEN